MDRSAPPPPSFAAAAGAFRPFFRELREAFLEREALFTQLELALLAREHVLVFGPPGTGKSAIAHAVLGRIVDADTGAPSLFARQLTETSVQTDLVGPVDFKVLTETGRTEHLVEEGILGAAHAFLDEVFDGRDMLLRSLLNTLHERELKHGRKVTPGRTSCVVMTSNRLLSEVVARSPELLAAFADRLSFVCFVPRAFARPESRAAMLARALQGQQPQLRASLTLQQLEVLQAAVTRVQVPAAVLEGLEVLAGQMERALQAHAQGTPEGVPARTFSQRGLVKALWVLRAAVVHDRIWAHPDRPLEATPADLAALGSFFATGGPAAEALELLQRATGEPRERSQLERVRAEGRAFTEALEVARRELEGGGEREAAALQVPQERARAEALLHAFHPGTALEVLASLRGKLVPGPRYAGNRAALLAASRAVLLATHEALGRGAPDLPGEAAGTALLAALAAALELSDAVPELRDGLLPLARECAAALAQLQERAALAAEATALEGDVRLDALVALAGQLAATLREASVLTTRLLLLAPVQGEAVRAGDAGVRRRIATALRGRAEALFVGRSAPEGGGPGLAAAARGLAALEQALCAVDPGQAGLREVLLIPLARAHARRVLTEARFTSIEEFMRVIRSVLEVLQTEGVSPAPVLADCVEVIEHQVLRYARAQPRAPAARPPSREGALGGEAYRTYREQFARRPPGAELAALRLLEAQLAATPLSVALSAAPREAVASVELQRLEARAEYLRRWVELLLEALPSPEQMVDPEEAEGSLDRLVRSRFPLLALREGELVRLSASLAAIARESGALVEDVHRVERVVHEVGQALASYSQWLLGVRAAR